MHKRLSWAMVLALLLVGLSIGTAGAATKPHAKTVATPTCTYTAWYRWNSEKYYSGGGDSAGVSLYVDRDIYTGTFCGYLYAAVDYTNNSGWCTTFVGSVRDHNNSTYSQKAVTPGCPATGSFQTPFYHVAFYDQCWHGYVYWHGGTYGGSTDCYPNG